MNPGWVCRGERQGKVLQRRDPADAQNARWVVRTHQEGRRVGGRDWSPGEVGGSYWIEVYRVSELGRRGAADGEETGRGCGCR